MRVSLDVETGVSPEGFFEDRGESTQTRSCERMDFFLLVEGALPRRDAVRRQSARRRRDRDATTRRRTHRSPRAWGIDPRRADRRRVLER